ncbi:MAG TPA: deoxyribodipyrimidine photo-lyase [Bacteroidales bacterium]|nr:deoxyribodipyrimidine photo-lyase [Bacteroidales bacterium]HPF03874.1 deoxyribodipyrimidine photo-lyase [Bacteroidales bacterium]HPJ60451.1 deoxyribodipyrimidine photo-lyase [Bacteroidales bacterium]HPR12292.1 deoxyribodipyrimidine photo-lyase [Bacteroidales bacterium]HRW83856.1 deoxyribodipyrimidine photo-lyase [Bacteroidales bacterium]
MKISIFWFRRDLRLEDNTGLNAALSSGNHVLPLFIFDTNIIDELPKDDPRISFIYNNLSEINRTLRDMEGSQVLVLKGDPVTIWKKLTLDYNIEAVYLNRDYEPYACDRDRKVEDVLKSAGINMYSFCDQVIFEKDDILKADSRPYTVFTPYKNRWMQKFREQGIETAGQDGRHPRNFLKSDDSFPGLPDLGFSTGKMEVRHYDLSSIPDYDLYRDIPAADRTSYLSPHLRFGTVSIRLLVEKAFRENLIFLNELIWREFFMQILYHFPRVVTENFRTEYDDVQWRNDEKEFERWCSGETGYPMVDAGMRQLNETGWMHNRVRMITAGFLCKHLLIDWRWGEAYFARKLLDYELSSNNGNWQWAAGTGCDAAPYFRVFNPGLQQKRFDPRNEYVKKWIPELNSKSYPAKIVDHNFARNRAVETYRSGLRRNLFK